jgi:hypothetical protein
VPSYVAPDIQAIAEGVNAIAPNSMTESSVDSDIEGASMWAGFQKRLHKTEKKYLRALDLGDPILCQQFWVSEKDISPSKTMCVLFPRILLFFRQQTDSVYTRFEKTGRQPSPDGNVNRVSAESVKWGSYAVLFPRHIATVSSTPNGFFHVSNNAY